MRLKHLSGLILALFSTSPLYAFDAFVVKDIRVEGLQRTEAGTVFSYLPVKVGDTLNEDKASQAIKALYGTGFFKDVRLEVDKGVLIVVIDERPAIGLIEFEGNKAFESDKLRKGLKEAGISESRILDRALLERAEQELKRQYLNSSYYSASVTTEITPLERNRVSVKFKVVEGEVAAIREVSITGSQKFSEKDLKKQIAARPKHWFAPLNWLSKDHEYSKPKLQGDLESIRSYYMNRGYLDFNIEANQVSISPDKRDVYIALALAEGEQYRVASVKVTGDLIVSDDVIRSLVLMRPGDIFSREMLTETNKAISERLANEGYAFANVNAAPELNKEKREVSFTIFVDPGKRVYVRQVNVIGNTRTRDEVIRRETRQFDSAWYDGAKIKQSKARLDRLGYFDETNVETPAVPGTSDQVDMNVTVKERATGNFSLGAGYSTTDKLVLSGSISQTNIFGSGNSLNVSLNTGSTSRTIVTSFTNPYFTPEGMRFGYDLYHRTYQPSTTTTVDTYKTASTGAGLRVGYPIAEDDLINFGLSFDSTLTGIYSDSSYQILDFVNRFGDRTTTALGTIGWSYDSRDNYLAPTRGLSQSLTAEVALPVAEQRYYRIRNQTQYFLPVVFKGDSLMLQANLGYASGYGGKPVPFFKNYYAGGIGSVRGFKDNSLGPQVLSRDGETWRSSGGTRTITVGAEYYAPMPFTGVDKTFRISAFVDGGQVWGVHETVALADMRYSTGLALAWISPIGPLKFSFAHPLNKKEGDKTQRFQFQLGNIF